jgi:hypothetical protein
MESLLQEKIETLRFEMIKQAMMCGSLTLESVISVSQQLDRYIVLYQKLKSKNLYPSSRLVGSIATGRAMAFHLLLTINLIPFFIFGPVSDHQNKTA